MLTIKAARLAEKRKLRMEKTIKDFTADELSLLMFLETQCVDNAHRFSEVKVNDSEMKVIQLWHDEGFVTCKKLPIHYIRQWENKNGRNTIYNTHYIELSENAYQIAYQCRREKAQEAITRFYDLLKKVGIETLDIE